jgi:hypothetical protein
MFDILQVIISVVVIYVIFSVVVFFIVEWISSFLQLRGKMLKNAVFDLFRNDTLGKQVYHHPLVESLRAPNNKLTSYIPSSGFASALIDTIGARGSSPENAYHNFLKGVNDLQEGHLKTLLTSLSQKATDLESLTISIEKWYNDCMDRVSGWYKRKMKVFILVVAAVITLSFNIDTIYIVRVAKADPVLRQRLNTLADQLLADSVFKKEVHALHSPDVDYYEDYVSDSSVNESDTSILHTQDHHGPVNNTEQDKRLQQWQYLNQLVSDSDLPIGWPVKKGNPWLYIIMGWSITIVALSAGAPFWFDVLKKLVNLRSTGPKPSNNP